MTQHTYAALWDYARQIESGEMTVEQAEALCKAERDRVAKAQRSTGRKARSFTLRGQLREWWRFGVPCGLSCTVFCVNIADYVQ
jgi:hypothetical protein